jgi:hypothetical protein
MYQDQDEDDEDPIKLFARQHARARISELARHIDDGSSDDADVFAAHADVEKRSGLLTALLGVWVVAVLFCTLVAFWK